MALNTEIHPQPVKKPRPSFYSRLFSRSSRSRPLAEGDMTVGRLLIAEDWVDSTAPNFKDENAGDDLEDFEDEY